MSYKCVCGKEFKYYYLLVRHQDNRETCKNNNGAISGETEDIHTCNICDKDFSSKYTLKRHRISCMKKSADEIEEHKSTIEHFQEDITNNFNTENSKFILSSLLTQVCDPNNIPVEQYLTNLIQTLQTLNKQKRTIQPNNIQVDINNGSNNSVDNSTDNSTTDNSTTDNSTTNITNNTTNSNNITNSNNTSNTNININMHPVIYPFGYENLNFLSNKEMLEIITGPRCLIDALEKIYSSSENKNCHKRNINRDQVTVVNYVNNEYKLQVLKDREFQNQMVKQLIFAVQRMFYKCKSELDFEDQLLLWQNIKLMEKKHLDGLKIKKQKNMPTNLSTIIDCISNLLSTGNEDITVCNDFNEFKRRIVEPEYKQHLITLLSVVLIELKSYQCDLENVTITEEQLHSYWLDPDQSIKYDNPINKISKENKLEDTYRYRYLQEMVKEENKQLNETQQSIGNINTVSKIRHQRAEDEVKEIQENFNLSDIEAIPFRQKLILEPQGKYPEKVNTLHKRIKKKQNAIEQKATEKTNKKQITSN